MEVVYHRSGVPPITPSVCCFILLQFIVKPSERNYDINAIFSIIKPLIIIINRLNFPALHAP